MDTILPEDEVATEALTAILDEGAVSFRIDDDGDIYVHEFASPCWIMIDSDRKFLRFYSYIRAASSDEAAILDFANHCNDRIAMVRFAYAREHRRFFGTYELPYRGGILPSHILRTTRDFAAHFNFVLNHEDRDNLLIPSEEPDEPSVTHSAPPLLN